MTYGAQFINDGGDVIIDGENPCCFLHEVGDKSFTATRGDSGGNAYLKWFEAVQLKFESPITTQEPPFVCGYSVSGNVLFGYIAGEPGNWTGMMVTTSLAWVPYGSGTYYTDLPSRMTGRLKYAVYSQQGKVRSKGDWGLLVNDAGGRSVFDSRKYPFILEGNFQYRRWGRNNGATINLDDAFLENGYSISPPSADSWPLLTTLNQMLWLNPSPEEAGLAKVFVAKEGGKFVYKLGFFYTVLALDPIYEEWSGWYPGDQPRPTPNFDRLPNLGGGQNAYNLIVFGRVPMTLQ